MGERQLLESIRGLPPEAQVPVGWIREQIGRGQQRAVADEELVDLTVAGVAELLGRAPSTIRGWLSSGKLRGYKLGREWRIPRSALRELSNGKPDDNGQRPGLSARRGPKSTLGAWRSVYGAES